MSILIKGVQLDGRKTDIFIDGHLIEKIGDNLKVSADEMIEGAGLAAVPSFVNGHTHAAMTLMRGYGADLPLMEWLNHKIWPLEAKITEEDVYWGVKLACLEMIKSGTTFFSDMYWHYHGTARAVEESGLRALIAPAFLDLFDPSKLKKQIAASEKMLDEAGRYGSRVAFAMGPHAIYTVSEDGLRWAQKFAAENNLMIHVHLAETEKEVADCVKKYGCRPAEFLARIGFLGSNVVAAHGIWLNAAEAKILAESGVKIVYNPTSNMKLSSGAMPYRLLKENGVKICLGTDGCASNDNLDMLEEMKFAALLQKHETRDPSVLTAAEIFCVATRGGAEVFNLNTGEIKEGKLADLLLVDLRNSRLIPSYDLTAGLVYAANENCIQTTICDGKILMRNRQIEGEAEIIEMVNKTALNLLKRI